MLGKNYMTERSLLLTEDSSGPLRLYMFRFFAANEMCNHCTLKDIRKLRSPKGRDICSLFYVCDQRRLSLPAAIPLCV
jgi:hypothetical protein